MADDSYIKTDLDSTQVIRRVYDEEDNRLRVDAEVTATIGEVSVIIRADEGDNIAIVSQDGTRELNINPDGSIDTNVNIDSANGDSILSVGTEDGTTAGTQHVQKIGSDGKLEVKDTTVASSLNTIATNQNNQSDQLTTLINTVSTSANQVNGLQKTQVVDGAGNFMPAGDAASRGVYTRLTDGTDNLAINVDGSINVAVNQSALPTGAATSALQTTGNNFLNSIDSKLNTLGQKTSANSVPVVLASDSSPLPASNAGIFLTSSASGLNSDPFPSTDVSAYSNIFLQVTGPFSGTLTFQGSNDGTNFSNVNMQIITAATTAPAQTTTAVGFFKVPIHFRYFRLRFTAYTSGTATVSAFLTAGTQTDLGQRSVAATATQSGTWVQRLQDGTGNAITSAAAGATRPLDVTTVTPSGTRVDPTQIRSLTSSDVVTANQGGSWDINNITGSVSLPNGASTSANQTTGNNSLSSIDGKTPALGQALAADSVPVVLPASQIATLTPPTSVAVNNGTGAAAVNIQDGGNSITVDGTVAATQSGSWTTTVTQPTGSNLHTVVDSGTITVTQATGTNLHTVVDSSALPTGASTSALQTTGNNSLASIDTKTTDGTQRTRITDGTNNVAVSNSAPAGTEQALITRNIPSGTQTISGTVAATQSGTWNVGVTSSALPTGAATEATLATRASETTLSTLNGKVPANLTVTSNRLQVDGSGVTQPISAASLPLPTGAATSANQTTANGSLSSMDTKLTSVQTTSNSTATNTSTIASNQTNGTQRTLVADQVGNLLPSGDAVARAIFVRNNEVDDAPATQNITAQDTGSISTAGANAQNRISGTPTAGSVASFPVVGKDTSIFIVTGTWTGTLIAELSYDGGSTWNSRALHQIGTTYTTNNFTANFTGAFNSGGATNVRIRSTTAWTGTATVRVSQSTNPHSLYTAGPQKLVDASIQTVQATIKAASTAPATTDTALVVTQNPNPYAHTAATPMATSIGTSSTAVGTIPANAKMVIFTNTSANRISLAFGGGTAVLNSGVTLYPGGAFIMEGTMVPGNVTAIASVASSNLATQVFNT